MANNFITRFLDTWKKTSNYNKFNEAFIYQFGAGSTSNYDPNNNTYLDKGYNLNSVVYSVINQKSTKLASIPYYVRKVEDKKSLNKLNRIKKATNNNPTIQQRFKQLMLEKKAFNEEELDFPLERPNPNQNWSEFHSLYETFLSLTGNVYIYMLCPNEGMNKNVPIAVYLLPSQDMKIVLKDKANLLGLESPISGYMLIQGKQYLEFEAENVIHIKYANPNYDENGAHLYGQSRLKAALRNIQNSNSAVDLNTKTLVNGGAFGFIHGKNIALTQQQANELKDRLKEMNGSTEELGKIAGMSGEVGFTRISLSTAELQPFEFLKFDEKQICNVLGWSDKLLNNDASSTYNNISEERQRVITDSIYPDLKLLEEALNNYFLPRFKGYENTKLVYDVSELPEMQQDTKLMVEWATMLLDRGVLNRNEVREIATFAKSDDANMELYTVVNDLLTLEEAIDSSFTVEPKV